MRTRFAMVGLLVLIIGLLLAWLFWPHHPETVGPPVVTPTPRQATPQPDRPLRAARPGPTDAAVEDDVNISLLRQAALGLLGLEAMNDTCAICKEYVMHEVCDSCPDGEGPFAFVRFDQVDEDGRPLSHVDQGFVYSSCVQPRVNDRVIAPAGPCTFTLFTYGADRHRRTGETITLDLVGGEEYALVIGELPQSPAKVPVAIAVAPDGEHIRIIDGTKDLPAGSWVTEVDGIPVTPGGVYEAQRLLTGDVDQAIHVRFVDPSTNEEHEVTVHAEDEI